MLIRLSKKQSKEKISIERIMYNKHYAIFFDRKRCVGCDICKTVCPREAISVLKSTKIEGKKLDKPELVIDEKKCSFCGICAVICPFNAIDLLMNNEERLPVLEKNAFPKIIHEIEIDHSKCPTNCTKCEEACPFNLIKVVFDSVKGSVTVNIDKEHCPGCRLCEVKCPYSAIAVRKIFTGIISINSNKCIENCHDCIDVCPIPGVLIQSKNKVTINEKCCIYCGTCKVVCPINDALYLQRDTIYHTSIKSGAWNKALEKLTTVYAVTKELREKSSEKARSSVKRLFVKERC